MIQNWSIRSRSQQCALSERHFVEGETFHTAIYFDPETSGYTRRDISVEAWKQELSERKPIADWKTLYSPTLVEAKPEVTSKESAAALLQRFVEEDETSTENARYILVLMLERKRILTPTATKETEAGRMLFYENKKTGEVFMIRDPELRLDELAQMQDEVAMLLGFGGPAAEAAKSVGMKFTPDGKLETKVVKANESKVEVSDVAASSTESEEEMGEVPEDELTDHSTELAA
jgi:hypothetical protein